MSADLYGLFRRRDWVLLTSKSTYNNWSCLGDFKRRLVKDRATFVYVTPSKRVLTNLWGKQESFTGGSTVMVDKAIQRVEEIITAGVPIGENIYVVIGGLDDYVSVFWWNDLLRKLANIVKMSSGIVKVVISGYSPALLCAGVYFDGKNYDFTGDGVYLYDDTDKTYFPIGKDGFNDLTMGYWKLVKVNLRKSLGQLSDKSAKNKKE